MTLTKEDWRQINEEIAKSEVYINESSALRKKAIEFVTLSNDAKGRFGEKLIEFMLQSTGWIVIPFGYEKSFPIVKDEINFNKPMSAAINKVRSMPDFFIINQNTRIENDGFFVEVKHLTEVNGTFNIPRLRSYIDFWPETIIVIVKKTHPYLLFQEVKKLTIKDKYTIADFQTYWKYRLGVSTIARLLAKFRSSCTDIEFKTQIDSFERCACGANTFYAYNTPYYHCCFDEYGKYKEIRKTYN